MPSVYTIGELLVEIMRPGPAQPLHESGSFLGPFPSGAPAIFASAAARLGLKSKIWGAVGQDAFGELLVHRLKRDGVDCQSVLRCPDKSTAVAFVAYTQDGDREFIYHIDGTAADQQTFQPTQETPDAFHVMGCSLLASRKLERQILTAVEHYHRQGALISFDPNIRPSLLRGRSFPHFVEPVLSRCHVLLPGTGELLLCAANAPDVHTALNRLWQRYPQLRVVVVKQGDEGVTIYSRDQSPIAVAPAPADQIVDPTGAGDYFDAGFLAGYLGQQDLASAGALAAAMGAANVTAFGPMEAEVTSVSLTYPPRQRI